MKIYCKSAYANQPHQLFFSGPGWYEQDQDKIDFLLKDAPENFSFAGPEPEVKAPDAPAHDKQVKTPAKKKAAGG